MDNNEKRLERTSVFSNMYDESCAGTDRKKRCRVASRISSQRWFRPLCIFIAAACVCAAVLIFEPHAAEVFSAQGETYIFIDIDARTLTLYRDGKQEKRYSVAVGKSSTPSPIGVFKVNHKAVNWGTGFGTRWIGINCTWGKFGIHGTNKPGSIGTSASHGCFRMLNRDVEDLYKRVSNNTIVVIERGAYGPLGSSLRTLEPGDRGADVKQVQLRLNAMGYECGNADGVYGEGTKRAIMKFKKDKGLAASHNVDGATYRVLGLALFE